ncbi:MAG TPA: AraC family transcriptional regulator [Verrucomicrobiae bacterium]|nr:AraC family transcriptional regulator [Verrucomicrobiae bacterium]
MCPPKNLVANRSQRRSSAKSDALLPRKYRELIRQHFGRLLGHLFADFTGLHFHIAWAPGLPRPWDARTVPIGCSAYCRLVREGTATWAGCNTHWPKHLAAALKSECGHHFTCRLGLRNYWAPLRVRGETLGIAFLQALDHPAARPSTAKRSVLAVQHCFRQAGARVMSRSEFARAARFMRLIIQHLETSSLADLRKAELTRAGRAVIALEKEQSRLHQTLRRHLPATPPSPRPSGAESHPEQIVHRLLERLELDYGKPTTLRNYAREMGMNTAYLSDLFSRTVGIPFKTYLTDLRLEKAKALLNDPAKTASDVASAIGYSSENRFRSAFKKATGLSPSVWRETMQIDPPQPAP